MGGHTGFEDHWASGQFHYIHHAKFECNYGEPSVAFLDIFFGTYKDRLDKLTGSIEQKPWSAQSYLGLQNGVHLVHTAGVLLIGTALCWGVMLNHGPGRVETLMGVIPIGTAMGFLGGFAPILWAFCLWCYSDKMPWNWPFNKECLYAAYALNV